MTDLCVLCKVPGTDEHFETVHLPRYASKPRHYYIHDTTTGKTVQLY